MLEIKFKISFSDCDLAGIIFFSRIFEYAHKGYEELINTFELDENYWSNQQYSVPIINSSSKYYKPLKFNDEILIKVFVNEIKTSSFELCYEIYKGEDLHCVVNTVHIFINPLTWEKISIPYHIKDKLNTHLK